MFSPKEEKNDLLTSTKLSSRTETTSAPSLVSLTETDLASSTDDLFIKCLKNNKSFQNERKLISFFKSFKENLVKSNYLFLGSFVALSFTGDFVQNHSISVLFFLIFFKLIFERTYE